MSNKPMNNVEKVVFSSTPLINRKPLRRIVRKSDKYKLWISSAWTKTQNFLRINQKYIVIEMSENSSNSLSEMTGIPILEETSLYSVLYSKNKAVDVAKSKSQSESIHSVVVYCVPRERVVWSWYRE
jgi:hypothetical protein